MANAGNRSFIDLPLCFSKTLKISSACLESKQDILIVMKMWHKIQVILRATQFNSISRHVFFIQNSITVFPMCAVFSSARIQSTAPGHVSEGAGTTAELLLLRASVTGAAGPGATRHQQPAAGCSSELSEDSVQPGASPPPLSRLTTWPPTAWTSDLRCCRAPAPRTRPPPSPRTCRIQVPEVNTRHVTQEPAC